MLRLFNKIISIISRTRETVGLSDLWVLTQTTGGVYNKVLINDILSGLTGALSIKGEWNAATDKINGGVTGLVGSSPDVGDFYFVNTDGATNLSGINTWVKGDALYYASGAWHRIIGGAQVTITGDQIITGLKSFAHASGLLTDDIGEVTPDHGTNIGGTRMVAGHVLKGSLRLVAKAWAGSDAATYAAADNVSTGAIVTAQNVYIAGSKDDGVLLKFDQGAANIGGANYHLAAWSATQKRVYFDTEWEDMRAGAIVNAGSTPFIMEAWSSALIYSSNSGGTERFIVSYIPPKRVLSGQASGASSGTATLMSDAYMYEFTSGSGYAKLPEALYVGQEKVVYFNIPFVNGTISSDGLGIVDYSTPNAPVGSINVGTNTVRRFVALATGANTKWQQL